jgi:OOP family OmpA-OmpF porin
VNDAVQDIQIQSIEIPEFCWLKKPVDLPVITATPKPAPIEFLKLRFEDIQFENNKEELPFVTPACLLDLVSYLFQNPNKSIEIHGHTDEVGNVQANLSLSERRASSVKKYLVDQGISGDRIKTVAFGNSKPKVRSNTTEARKINRRIEIILP